MMPALNDYLILSAILFAIGTAGVFVRRNVITILLSIEIMLNAVNLSFVAFGRSLGTADGQIIVFFVMTVAAAEAAAYRKGYDAGQHEAKAESDRRSALALEEIKIAIQGIAARFGGIEISRRHYHRLLAEALSYRAVFPSALPEDAGGDPLAALQSSTLTS